MLAACSSAPKKESGSVTQGSAKYYKDDGPGDSPPSNLDAIPDATVHPIDDGHDRAAGHDDPAAAHHDGRLRPRRRCRCRPVRRLRGPDRIDPVAATGAVLEDIRGGLVDFRTRHRGEIVWLCWRFGESEVGHWHGMQGGFAARKTLETIGLARRLN